MKIKFKLENYFGIIMVHLELILYDFPFGLKQNYVSRTILHLI